MVVQGARLKSWNPVIRAAARPTRLQRPGLPFAPNHAPGVTDDSPSTSYLVIATMRAVKRVFVAGATGVLGRELVKQLVAGGHEVVGMTRRASKRELLRSLGVTPVVADALDPDQVAEAVAAAKPEVIVHELTALSGKVSLKDARHPERSSGLRMTNRLRTEATQHLLGAGRAVGARRFVAQSVVAFRFAPLTGPLQTETDPLDLELPAALRPGMEATARLEQAVTAIDWGEGIAVRYGSLYGPETGISHAPNALMAEPIRKRRFPLIGSGGAVWSFVHLADAISATVAAVERGQSGVYNIVDDDPAPMREWLPALASALGAKPPLHVPRWLIRLAAGEAAALMMTDMNGGASNSKAKRELDWQPSYPSWRQGFKQGLG